jgi:hypothetical protein
MVRPYPHKPDVAFFVEREEIAFWRDLSVTAQRTLSQGRGDIYVTNSGVSDCWAVAAISWLLEEPFDMPELMTAAAGMIQTALETMPAPLMDSYAYGWCTTTTMAGRADLTLRVADRVLDPDGVEVDHNVEPSTLATTRAFAALITGRDSLARTLLPTAPLDDAYEIGINRTIIAILDQDQATLDAAAAERFAERTRQARRSRRRSTHLIDRLGVGLMLAAQDHGLTPTPDIPDIPLEILATRITPLTTERASR